MTSPQPPALPDWITDHITKYVESNGEDGHLWRGVPTLLLTTTGRQSGEERLLPLIYGRDGANYLVVASKGGAATHPAWYQNLVAEPLVHVQVGSEKFKARARTAGEGEKPRLWAVMASIWPAYDEYQQSTSRPIPVVILERTT